MTTITVKNKTFMQIYNMNLTLNACTYLYFFLNTVMFSLLQNKSVLIKFKGTFMPDHVVYVP